MRAARGAGYASFKVARASDLVEAAILVGSSKLKIREGRGWSAKTTHKLAVRELPAPAVVLDRGDERRFSVLLPAGGGALEFVSDHASARDVLALTLRSFAGMSGQSGGMSGQSGHSGSAGGASAARRPGAAGAGGAGGEAPIVGAGVDEDADEEGYMDHRKANDRYADRLARPGGAVRSTRDSGARGSGGDDDDDASTIAPTEDGGACAGARRAARGAWRAPSCRSRAPRASAHSRTCAAATHAARGATAAARASAAHPTLTLP